MSTTLEARRLHTLAVSTCAAFVQRVLPADLGRPTPCSGWSLSDLLAHLTAQHLGFAAAAEGRGADPAVWRPAPDADPVAAHAVAVERVLAAFAAEDVPDRLFDLPEISTQRQFRGAEAITFHTVDYAVHGWDVARSLGLPYQLPADLAATTLRAARLIPDGDLRLQPGAAFGPALEVPAGADPLAEALLLLGRDPGWTAEHPIG